MIRPMGSMRTVPNINVYDVYSLEPFFGHLLLAQKIFSHGAECVKLSWLFHPHRQPSVGPLHR
jgi:hypothetical protein